MVAPRKSDPSGKKVSKLYVEPAELARKLIKELESTKVSQGGRTWVRDQYTVFLCREDFARFRNHLDELVRKLESHMEKHVQNRRYATPGAVTVELTMDPDLKPGYFGVLAEQAEAEGALPRGGASAPNARALWDQPEGVDYDDDYEAYVPDSRRSRGPVDDFGAGAAAPPLPPTPGPGMPRPGVPMAPPAMPAAPPILGPSYARPFAQPAPAAQPPAAPSYAPPSLPGQQAPQMVQQAPPPIQTRMTPPVPAQPAAPRAAAPAAPRMPAAEPLILKVNGQERIFPQGKAVVGRSRDVDLQVDNADVSRRHAVIYWSEGSVVVKDLGSTNGTMVNGYPIDSTVVRSSDVIRIGNATITVVSR